MKDLACPICEEFTTTIPVKLILHLVRAHTKEGQKHKGKIAYVGFSGDETGDMLDLIFNAGYRYALEQREEKEGE